jgi:hypothetical protein
MAKGLKSLGRSLERVPFVPVVAVLFGLVAGILVLATPLWLFERGVVASGLPEMMAAAAPPLGDKARIMAAILAAAGVGGLLWLGLMPLRLFKPKPVRNRGSRIKADDLADEAVRTAKGRRPLFAESDLGAPFMSDEAIAHAREELVLETAAIEEAVEPEEVEEIAAEPEANAVEHTDEPQPQEAPEPFPAPVVIAGQASIAGLLDRLENALERRERRTGGTAPVLPGDMAALRKALGSSAAHH